jgi:hypothetical protein
MKPTDFQWVFLYLSEVVPQSSPPDGFDISYLTCKQKQIVKNLIENIVLRYYLSNFLLITEQQGKAAIAQLKLFD